MTSAFIRKGERDRDRHKETQESKQHENTDRQNSYSSSQALTNHPVLLSPLIRLMEWWIYDDVINIYKLESRLLGGNINNLRYADDTTLMAESEELESLLMKIKEENEKAGLNSTFRKLRSWHSVPSLHGK